MKPKLARIGRELMGLFVDDGRFALAIGLWLLMMAWATRFIALGVEYRGPVLFLGLAALLAWTCLTATASHAKRRARSATGRSG